MDKQHAHGEQPYQHGQYHHGNDAANFPCDISQSHIVHVRNLPEYLRIFQAAENMRIGRHYAGRLWRLWFPLTADDGARPCAACLSPGRSGRFLLLDL